MLSNTLPSSLSLPLPLPLSLTLSMSTSSRCILFGAPMQCWYVQVLVWSGPQSTADGARCKAALLAAHNMRMPVGADANHCTRIVYLVDPVRYEGQLLPS